MLKTHPRPTPDAYKHLERWSFAALGIKEIYLGQPLVTVMRDRWSDAAWLIGLFTALLAGLFTLPFNITNLKKD